jgi:hypothetical protein
VGRKIVAERSGLDQLLETNGSRCRCERKIDRSRDACLGNGIDAGLSRLRRCSQRLLAEDGLAGFGNGPDDLLMGERRRRHIDALDGRVADEFIDAGDHRDRGVRCGRIVGRNDPEGGVRLETFCKPPAHCAEPDDTDAVHEMKSTP